MGRKSFRYSDFDEESRGTRELHPAWRGLGCLLVVVIGVWSYILSGWFLSANASNGWVYVPPEIMNLPFAPWLPEGALVQAVVALLITLFSFGIMNLVYGILFPLRRGEQDVPPLKRRPGGEQ